MKFIIMIVSLLLLSSLVVLPVLILKIINKSNIKFKFIIYLTLATIISFIITFFLAWWSYISDKIMLEYYGFNFEAMNEDERYKNVLPENIENVKRINISVMGIGWLVKAFISFTIYYPYLMLIYIVNYGINFIDRKNNNEI